MAKVAKISRYTVLVSRGYIVNPIPCHNINTLLETVNYLLEIAVDISSLLWERASVSLQIHVYIYCYGHMNIPCYLACENIMISFAGIWSSPPTTGDRPPPCLHFSFTAIDPHRAVLFGGRQEHGRVNDAYILDLWEMVCSSVYLLLLCDYM